MITNAYLMIVQEKNFSRIPVTWVDNYFEQGAYLYELLFCSDNQFIDWDKGHPEMDVFLADDESIRSRVMPCDEAGELFSNTSLTKLTEK